MHAIDLPDWAVSRGAPLNDFPQPDAGRTALINIDMQNVFVAEGQIYGNRHARDIVSAVNALSRGMRSIGAPVIWTRQTHMFEGPFAPPAWQYDLSRADIAAGVQALQADAAGHALFGEMEVEDDDIVIDKYRYGALSCPAGNLSRVLRHRGITTIVITGTLTNCCCETTAREAYMAGYKVIVVPDAMAAVTDAEHNAALLNLRVNFADLRNTREILGMVKAFQAQGAS